MSDAGHMSDMSPSSDPGTLHKISVMEEELASLRKQIADLVLNQENTRAHGNTHHCLIFVYLYKKVQQQ
jgi:hypothetical protein